MGAGEMTQKRKAKSPDLRAVPGIHIQKPDMVVCIWNPSIPKVKWEAETGEWPRCLKAKPVWNMYSSSTQGEKREEAGFSDRYTLINTHHTEADIQQ